MKSKIILTIIFFILFPSNLLLGNIYKWTDENGVAHFSNVQPSPDIQKKGEKFEELGEDNNLKNYEEIFNKIIKNSKNRRIAEKKIYILILNELLNNMTFSAGRCISICNLHIQALQAWQSDEDGDILSSFLIEKTLKEKNAFSVIKQSKNVIETLLRKLNNLPDLYPEIHKKFIQLYGVYSQLNTLALSPSGNLLTYIKKVNDLKSEFIKIKNEITVMLPPFKD